MKTYASIDNSHRSADISFFEKAEEGKAWFSYVANTGRLIVILDTFPFTKRSDVSRWALTDEASHVSYTCGIILTHVLFTFQEYCMQK